MDVPPQAALVCDFINTRDVENCTDDFSSGADLSRWLAERGLIERTARASDADVRRTTALREGLRAVLEGHHDALGDEPAGSVGTRAVLAELDGLARQLPLRLEFGPDGPRLDGVGTDVASGLARILAAIAQSASDGSWTRVKVCPADTCRWAFYDSSKNHSRTWCTMRVCGNRAKTTSYRARQRSISAAT